MPYHRLSTSKIAKIIGCHPNTVRMYEQWKLLPAIPRSGNGYRLYTQDHLDQMRLAWLALHTTFPGKIIRRSLTNLVKVAATGDLGEALQLAYKNLVLVRSELAQAEAAADLVANWANGQPIEDTQQTYRISEIARKLNVTCDMLRNWENNNLLTVPRDAHSRYRRYGQTEIARLRIIRMLRTSGYSIMSILRMLLQLDAGMKSDIRHTLDTPPEDEDIGYAADRWLTTLTEQENIAQQIIDLLQQRLR